jgi:methylated-DNA-[protein]-cysteine S-methyltransferase
MRQPDRAFSAVVQLPPCRFGVIESGGVITALYFLAPDHPLKSPTTPLGERVAAQLSTYLADPAAAQFELPVHLQGTEFQKRVWAEISAIPTGRVRQYQAIARDLGSVARAVGQACGANPLPIVVPCHRVVSAAGIGGFANHTDGWLIQTKRWLLWHEGLLI